MRKFRIGSRDAGCIALGSSYFGTTWAEEDCFRLMDRFLELGGDCLDTARVYGAWFNDQYGAAERVIGKYLEDKRLQGKVIVVTKGGNPLPQSIYTRRLSRGEIIDDIKRSLDDLRLAKIDMYLLHRDDEDRSAGEIIETMNELLSLGYTSGIGCSNWRSDRIREANRYAVEHGLRGFEVSQIQWSLAETTPELYGDDTIVCMNESEYEFYKSEKFPLMAYASQAKGFFAKGAVGGVESLGKKALERFGTEKNLRRLEIVKRLSEEKRISPAAIALQVITDSELLPMAIIGCRTIEQLEDTLSPANLTSQELEMLRKG